MSVNTKPKETISARWWLNYFAVIAMVGHVILHEWMDADKITEGTAFVLMTFVAKVFIAYLTSWLFLMIVRIRDRVERRAFYKAQLMILFDGFVTFYYSFFTTQKVEAQPLNLLDISGVAEPLVMRDLRKADQTSDIDRRLMYEMLVSTSRTTTERAIKKMREKRHVDEDALFDFLDRLEWAFTRTPSQKEMDAAWKDRMPSMGFEICIGVMKYYAMRIHELQQYCHPKLVPKDYIEKRIKSQWDNSDEFMIDYLTKDKSRTTCEELFEQFKGGKYQWKGKSKPWNERIGSKD